MSSLLRRQQRKIARQNGTFEPKVQPFRPHPAKTPDEFGGYDVLHPTKGWQRFSAARLRAMATLNAVVEIVQSRRAVARPTGHRKSARRRVGNTLRKTVRA